MRFEKLLGVGTGLTIAVAPKIASACAVCGLGPNDVGGHAFNSSVLFMMAIPYSTVLVIGGIVFYSWRKAQRRSATLAASTNRN